MRKIGVVIPGIVHLTYSGELYRAISDTAKENRCSLVTSIQNVRRQDDLTHFYGRDGCDGAVVVVPHNFDQIIARLRENNCPCVLVGYTGERDEQPYPTIEVNNREGIMQVMDHLIGLGHRRIAFITGMLENASARQRLQGYRDALQAANIPADPALIAEGSWALPENFTAAQRLLRLSPRPTAIVTSSDVGAFAAYQAAREVGLEIGRQISITGFDDMQPASNSVPALTTVRQHIYQTGQLAVEMLLACLNGEPLPQTSVQLDTELIVRQSTAAPQY